MGTLHGPSLISLAVASLLMWAILQRSRSDGESPRTVSEVGLAAVRLGATVLSSTLFSMTSAARTPTLAGGFDDILAAVLDASRRHYGDRLIALAVFGSVGRGTMRPNSDIDLLLVVDPLPDRRLARVEEFAPVEAAVADRLRAARAAGIETELSPVFRTPAELAQGSPLLLDMTEDARTLHDPDNVLAGALQRLRDRLAALGARRIRRGNAWFWDLKPDYRPGDVLSR
jgi:hypothetical protein